MISFSPWYYRNLLFENDIIDSLKYYEFSHLDGSLQFEVLAFLKNKHIPNWLSNSEIYTNCDGTGTSQYKNIAAYKSISEALERWAFYVSIDSNESKKYCFDLNPSTTGMASLPGVTGGGARANAIMEASERWALHEFWRGNLPVIEHSHGIANLRHFEIITPFRKCVISLLSYKINQQYLYGFAAEETIEKSLKHALVELARNIRVVGKLVNTQKSFTDFKDISDRRLYYFSTEEGYSLFDVKVKNASKTIKANPKLICDLEIKGEWNKYTKVWRYLYDKSLPDSDTDHTFFMF